THHTLPISFFSYSALHLYLHSFPTRRSSDLFCPEFDLLETRGTVSNGQCFIKPRQHQFLRRFSLLRQSCGEGPFDSRPKLRSEADRKSTRLNSSHVAISYAVFCLKKKISINP